MCSLAHMCDAARVFFFYMHACFVVSHVVRERRGNVKSTVPEPPNDGRNKKTRTLFHKKRPHWSFIRVKLRIENNSALPTASSHTLTGPHPEKWRIVRKRTANTYRSHQYHIYIWNIGHMRNTLDTFTHSNVTYRTYIHEWLRVRANNAAGCARPLFNGSSRTHQHTNFQSIPRVLPQQPSKKKEMNARRQRSYCVLCSGAQDTQQAKEVRRFRIIWFAVRKTYPIRSIRERGGFFGVGPRFVLMTALRIYIITGPGGFFLLVYSRIYCHSIRTSALGRTLNRTHSHSNTTKHRHMHRYRDLDWMIPHITTYV